MKRIVTVQDVSCVGKCSGTVALPVLSVCGMETALLPTAVLSTHTGFSGFTFHDLTDELPAILSHWKQLQFRFDGFYSGYLGSIRQVRMVRDFFTDFQQNGSGPIFVDPVMGDRGKLYAGFTMDFAREMRSLCASADLIFPNLTEACAILEIPYREDFTKDELSELLKALSKYGCKQVMLTGVELEKGGIGALLYDARQDVFSHYETKKLPAQFHGTGDLFASTAVGGILRGQSTEQAMALAVDFVAECMRITLENPSHVTYGVEFEKALPWLIHRLETS